jgi:crotonobetainyl-CoA:carnitine CoA-transferase CaiB-like acyl-CoA transferase
MAVTRPLEGVRVLDFTQLLAGPSAAMLLGDLGAEIIKVEQFAGDLSRSLGPDGSTSSPIFLAYNRNKRSIAVDFKTVEGKRVIEKLVSRSHVVVEGFRPGVMKRHGLGYEELVKLRPQLVYASLSGFGSTGEGRERAGVDAVVQAASGMMAVTGDPDGPPMKVGFQVVDAAAGLMLSQGILASLMLRDATGEPQFFETSLMDVALFLQSPALIQASMTQADLPRAGNTAATAGYPTDLFVTQDAGYIQVAAYFPRQWELFCDALELGEVEHDARFSTNGARVQNADALRQIIQQVMKTRTRDEWMARLLDGGVIASDVRTHTEVLQSEQSAQNSPFFAIPVADARVESYSTDSHPIAWNSRASEREVNAPPTLGEHTCIILQELGYSHAQIEQLKVSGAVKGP